MRFNACRAGGRYFPLALVVFLVILSQALLLTGCELPVERRQVVLTTGFSGDEVFRIDTRPCTVSEVKIYLTNLQNSYESAFGDEIWEIDTGDVSLEENIKATVLNRLSRLKVMVLMAEKYEITLTDEESDQVEAAATEYYESLTDKERKYFGADHRDIVNMYRDYALADKVYRYIIKDINPEISDDEARILTIQRILIKTYTEDDEGNRIPMDQDERRACLQRAEEIRAKALAGEDFENLISLYNEAESGTMSFGAGEVDAALEKVAFGLEKNEIGQLVENEDGYLVVKCISTFNKEETDANKERIVKSRKRQVFGQEYSTFADTLTRIFNEELWEGITIARDDEVTTDSFFTVYNQYFE